MSETVTTSNSYKKLVQDYIDVFSSPQGERVLEDLRIFCGYDAQSWNGDPYDCVFHDGKRRVFLHINGNMNIKSDTIRLLKESEKHE